LFDTGLGDVKEDSKESFRVVSAPCTVVRGNIVPAHQSAFQRGIFEMALLSASKRPPSSRLVLSPLEPLVAGGGAEAFERDLQQLIRTDHRQLVVDLSGVHGIDSAGIRALVRGHTSAMRLGGRLRLAAVPPVVQRVLDLSRLSSVFETHESIDAARIASWPWRTIRISVAASILCTALVWAGLKWPLELTGLGDIRATLESGRRVGAAIALHPLQPFIEVLKLVVATFIGLVVTAIHQPTPRDRPASMEQAQTLLCVAGAMMMIIIGDSLARAFGIAGAAGIIRFRTPVDDPKDVTILFLLMGLGMSVGLGAFAVAGLGTGFLCIALMALSRVSTERARVMLVEISAAGREFPATHVEGVFARNNILFEPRQISTGDDVMIKYHTWLDPRMSLDDLSLQLMTDGTGVKTVTWENPKARERS
jgi:anti-anti-sigma factor